MHRTESSHIKYARIGFLHGDFEKSCLGIVKFEIGQEVRFHLRYLPWLLYVVKVPDFERLAGTKVILRMDNHENITAFSVEPGEYWFDKFR